MPRDYLSPGHSVPLIPWSLELRCFICHLVVELHEAKMFVTSSGLFVFFSPMTESRFQIVPHIFTEKVYCRRTKVDRKSFEVARSVCAEIHGKGNHAQSPVNHLMG